VIRGCGNISNDKFAVEHIKINVIQKIDDEIVVTEVDATKDNMSPYPEIPNYPALGITPQVQSVAGFDNWVPYNKERGCYTTTQ